MTATGRPQILIVGCGPGTPDFVTPAARRAVGAADEIVGARRLLDLFGPDDGRPRIVADARIEPLLDKLAELLAAGRTVAVLVSGDPGLYSLAGRVIARLGRAACEVVPAVSSVQLAFARLGLDWADARIVSAHGRTPSIAPEELAACGKIAILAGTREAMEWSAAVAAKLGDSHVAYVCEDLSLPGERVRPLAAGELAACGASSLAIVVLVRRELLD